MVVGELGQPDHTGHRRPDVASRSAASRNVALKPDWDAGEIVLEIYEKLVEHTLIQPTFVCDYPRSVRAVGAYPSRRSAPGRSLGSDHRRRGDRARLLRIGRSGRAARLLAEQSLAAAAGDPEAMELDEEFLQAQEYGMPPAGGMGLGVDRLLGLFSGRGIRETILFPLLKPLS